MADVPVPWDQVADDVRRFHPNEDQDQLRRQYEARRELAIERHLREDDSEGVGQYLVRRAIPFTSSLVNAVDTSRYQESRQRVNEGNHEPGDIGRVADFERQQERDQQRGVGGQILSGIAHIPSIAGEAAIAGGPLGRLGQAPSVGRALLSPSAWGRNALQTAAMPSMWLTPAAERAAANGGDALSPENLGPAFLMGFAQTAVLGSFGKLGNSIVGEGVAPFLKRLATRTLTGMVEQQGVDAAAGALDNFLGEAWKTKTNYGILGNFVQGDAGKGWEHLAVQLATFGAFSVLHPILHGEQRPETPGAQPATEPAAPGAPAPPAPTALSPIESVQAAAKVIDRAGSLGMTKDSIAANAHKVIDTVNEALANKPNLTRQEVYDLFKGQKLNRFQQDFLESLALARPETAPEAKVEQPIAQEPQPPTASQAAPGGETVAEPAPEVSTAQPERPMTDPKVIEDAVAAIRSMGVKAKEAATRVQAAVEASDRPFQTPQEIIIAVNKAKPGQVQGPTVTPEERASLGVQPEAASPPAPLPPAGEGRTSEQRLRERFDAVGLTEREKTVMLERLEKMRSLRDIAADLGLSYETVRKDEVRARDKLGAKMSVAEMTKAGRAEPTADTDPGFAQPMTPEEAAASRRAKAPLNEQEKASRAIEDTADAFLKEHGYKNTKEITEDLIAHATGEHPEDASLAEASAKFEADLRKKGFSAESIRDQTNRFEVDYLNRELEQAQKEQERDYRAVASAQSESAATETVRLASEAAQAAKSVDRPQGQDQASRSTAEPGAETAPAGGPSVRPGRPEDIASPLRKPSELGPRHFATGTEPAPSAEKKLASGKTAIANATFDKEARAEGRVPAFAEAKKESDPAVWNAAERKFDTEPDYGSRLVDSIIEKPRSIEAVDTAALLMHKLTLINERRSLNKEAIGEKDPAKLKAIEDAREANLEQQMKLEKAANISGTELGRSLRFRRVLANEEYSLTGLLLEAAAAKKKPLTKEETKLIEDLHNQVKELQDKLAEATAGFDPGNPQSKETWEATRLETARKQQEIQQQMSSFRHEGMTTLERWADWWKRARVAELISGPVTAGKVGASSLFQTVAPSIGNMAGSALKTLPGIRAIAAKAPIEGRGFDPANEAAALKSAATAGLKDAKDTLLHGASDIDILNGNNTQPRSWLDFFGNLHSAEKAVAVRAEYERTKNGILADAKARGEAESPALIKQAEAIAYEKSFEVKFQQDNAIVTAVNKAINSLKRPENSLGARVLGHAVDLLLPIRTTPTNIIASAFEHILGLPLGLAKAGTAHFKGIEHLSTVEAEGIMRMMKRGTIGLPLLFLGYALSKGLGGFYSGRRTEGEVKEGEIETPFGNLPAWVTAHHPAFMALQVGASIKRAEEEVKRTGRQGLGVGIAKSLGHLIEEIPVVREQTEVARSFEGGFNAGALGRLAASFAVPALIKWTAEQTDREDGKPVQRKPEGFLEKIEVGIPGLRQNVQPRIEAIDDFHTELNRLATARFAHQHDPESFGRVFPQEREYAILEKFAPHIAKLEHAIKGDARQGRGPYRPGEAPAAEQIRQWRQIQSDLARKAVAMIRGR